MLYRKIDAASTCSLLHVTPWIFIVRTSMSMALPQLNVMMIIVPLDILMSMLLSVLYFFNSLNELLYGELLLWENGCISKFITTFWSVGNLWISITTTMRQLSVYFSSELSDDVHFSDLILPDQF